MESLQNSEKKKFILENNAWNDKFEDNDWNKKLVKSSVSERDAELRKNVYAQVFNRYNWLKELYKACFEYTETPSLSNLYFHATMESYVHSFAGFLSIERDMEMPTALLWYTDTLCVTDKRIILPNIGQEELDNIDAIFKISKMGYDDTVISPTGNNKLKIDKKKNIQVTAEPDMLITENNLEAHANMQKTMCANLYDIVSVSTKLAEFYTIIINENLVNCIKSMWHDNDDTYLINTQEFTTKFLDFNSRLDAFQSEIVNINTKMAERSIKGVNATAYLVDKNIGNWFKKLISTGNFVGTLNENYVDGLIGYYKGIPVLCSVDVGSNEGFAIHKTADGQLAPIIRGIFSPLTSIPLIENYNNPNQFAKGIYYQEANTLVAPELIQKFQIKD